MQDSNLSIELENNSVTGLIEDPHEHVDGIAT
jgi:hypothetical protein